MNMERGVISLSLNFKEHMKKNSFVIVYLIDYYKMTSFLFQNRNMFVCKLSFTFVQEGVIFI